jgi:all-trans-8'-apo-beta-carotenal 15,15'-oxygenase
LCQICAIKFADGKAHFRSKYVKTTGYVMEKKAKKLIFKGTIEWRVLSRPRH